MNFSCTCLLLLLDERPATAEELWQRLGIAAEDLRSTQILLDRFLARCGERLVL